jgi:hypothetical protein
MNGITFKITLVKIQIIGLIKKRDLCSFRVMNEREPLNHAFICAVQTAASQEESQVCESQEE